MQSRPAVALALLALLAPLGACQAVLGLEEGKPRGTGGAGGGATASASSTGGGGAASTSSTVSSTGSSSTTASSSGSTSSTSSTSGTGGSGGGTTSSSSSSSSSASSSSASSGTGGAAPTCNDGLHNGNETGVDCGGPDCPYCPTVLLLATGGATQVLAGEYHPGGGGWQTTMIAATSVEAPGLALTTAGKGVGLIRNATAVPPGALDDDVEAVIWSAGAWGAFASIGAAKTRGRPAIVSVDATAQSIVHGLDYKHYYAAWTGAQWTPVSDPVGGAAAQSFGPSAPELAVIGADAFAAFIDGLAGANHLTVQQRTAGVWQGKVDLFASAPAANFAISPSIAAVSGGPDLLVVYVRTPDKQLLWLARTAGSWSVAAPIPSAFTNDRAALTGLAGGGALLAFRGTDTKLYASRFTAGVWSAPTKAVGEALLASTPALARGVGGAEAELAYVDTANAVHHARLLNNAWSAPLQAAAAAGITSVAIAAGP